MALSDLLTAAIHPEPGQKPRDDELDLFGVTHPGKVRTENQDHFLVCTVHQQVVIHGTSLPDPDRLLLRGERLATMRRGPPGLVRICRRSVKAPSAEMLPSPP